MKIHLVQVIATPEVGEGAGIDERTYNAVNDAIIEHEPEPYYAPEDCLDERDTTWLPKPDYRTLICMGDDMCFICNMHKWKRSPGSVFYKEVKD